jgi:hypothetical protein
VSSESEPCRAFAAECPSEPARASCSASCGSRCSRESPPTHDELARIVDDAHADAEHRAAAAVALAATGDDGKSRLRLARDATADPGSRVAIDAAISDDDRALADALTEIGVVDRAAER